MSDESGEVEMRWSVMPVQMWGEDWRLSIVLYYSSNEECLVREGRNSESGPGGRCVADGITIHQVTSNGALVPDSRDISPSRSGRCVDAFRRMPGRANPRPKTLQRSYAFTRCPPHHFTLHGPATLPRGVPPFLPLPLRAAITTPPRIERDGFRIERKP